MKYYNTIFIRWSLFTAYLWQGSPELQAYVHVYVYLLPIPDIKVLCRISFINKQDNPESSPNISSQWHIWCHVLHNHCANILIDMLYNIGLTTPPRFPMISHQFSPMWRHWGPLFEYIVLPLSCLWCTVWLYGPPIRPDRPWDFIIAHYNNIYRCGQSGGPLNGRPRSNCVWNI